MDTAMKKRYLVIPFLLLSLLSACSEKTVITIENAESILQEALNRGKSLTLSGTSYRLSSSIHYHYLTSAASEHSLSINVDYANANANYSTNIVIESDQRVSTYKINKDSTSAYFIDDGTGQRAYDASKDSFIRNFFELPTYFVDQNLLGTDPLLKYLIAVSDSTKNTLASYNCYSSGGGDLEVRLESQPNSALDFTSFFSESEGVVGNNVSEITIALSNYLITSASANFSSKPSASGSASTGEVSLSNTAYEGSLASFFTYA